MSSPDRSIIEDSKLDSARWRQRQDRQSVTTEMKGQEDTTVVDTDDENMDAIIEPPPVRRVSEPLHYSPQAPNEAESDRWAQIRQNAAEHVKSQLTSEALVDVESIGEESKFPSFMQYVHCIH